MKIEANFFDNLRLFFIEKMTKLAKNRQNFPADAGSKIKIVHILLHGRAGVGLSKITIVYILCTGEGSGKFELVIRLPNPIRWPLTSSNLRDPSPSRQSAQNVHNRDFAEHPFPCTCSKCALLKIWTQRQLEKIWRFFVDFFVFSY